MRSQPPSPLARISLREATLAFVDVETTGLSAWTGDRICEVAVVRARGNEELERYTTLVNPLRPISPGAFAVNGIGPGLLASAPTFGQVAQKVREALSNAIVVAHNAPFDVGFLGRELRMAGEEVPRGPVLDTLALARRNFRFRSNSLGALARTLGVQTPEHRALADALTTRGVFSRLVDDLFPSGAFLGDLVRRQGGAISWPGAPVEPTAPVGLVEAVRRGGRLRLWYVRADGSETVRFVDPIRVDERDGWPCLVAFCHLRQEQRAFRLDRISRWELGSAEGPMPDD